MASSSASITFHLPGPGFSFRAKLLVDENPDVVEQVLAQLPLKSVLGHVVIAGETFWTPTRIVHLGRNYMVQRHLGAVYLNAPGQSICITYGKITESAKINKFAEVFEEDLPKLEEIGRLVYQQTVALPRHTLMEVHILSECCPRLERPEKHLPTAPSPSSMGHWLEVKAIIEKEIDRVWLEEPVEIQKLLLVHLEAYLMVMGGDVMSRFLKIAQYEDIQLPTLNRITKEFLVENFDLFEFMADLGLENMFKIGQMYSNALETLASKEEYIHLTGAMQTYINRMHRWAYFIFPWHLGVAFPHRKSAEVLAFSNIVTAGLN
ncbi:mikimopine synthase [Aspergillus novofumigatus IBT 16806]|uniref:Mikimopine synthase n=1 Tax=Aspergillus novofumigatus (strain IBT 16806) TaxID=1392255 RepID=A0A2I1CF61_ASPN1|nr:mikimopine synthase [Aspergillus novofumigatus IBT 16806]PKX96254.1 mikimopine synthase [Aspergillus novofumigatus IBT 16806]